MLSSRRSREPAVGRLATPPVLSNFIHPTGARLAHLGLHLCRRGVMKAKTLNQSFHEFRTATRACCVAEDARCAEPLDFSPSPGNISIWWTRRRRSPNTLAALHAAAR